MPKTEAQLRAQSNYMAKFHRPYVRIPHDDFERVKLAADAAGESLNTFMLKAILTRVDAENARENEKSTEE